MPHVRYHLTRRFLPLLVLLMAASGLRAQESFPATHFAALSSVEEVPQLFIDAAGLALFRLEGNTLHYRIIAAVPNDLITGAGFYRARRGAVGEAAHEFAFPLGAMAAGSWRDISQSDMALINSEGIYLNILTRDHPAGAIRAQVTRFPNLYTTLAAGAEIPPVSGSQGGGECYIVLNPAARRLEYMASWHGLTGPATMAHIHRALPGENGPILRPLTISAGDSIAAGALTDLSDDEIAALADGRAYVNVHTERYPDGEIRGDLGPVDLYTSFITPANVVPAVTGSGGEGLGYGLLFRERPARWSLVYTSFVYGDMGELTQADLHVGRIGGNGPRIRGLRLNGAYQDLTDFTIRSADTLRLLRDSMVYGNYITHSFPQGEIRGQLIPSDQNLNLPFGSGASVGVAGRRSEAAGAIRYDRAGESVLFIGDEKLDGELRLYTSLGGLAATARVVDGRARCGVGELPAGVYMAQVVQSGTRIAAHWVSIAR